MCASPNARTRRSTWAPEIYEIDPTRCTECVGHFDEPQCVQVCPVACIPVNPEHVESRETLWQKYQRLTAQARQDAPSCMRAAATAPRRPAAWTTGSARRSSSSPSFFFFAWVSPGLRRDGGEVGRLLCLRRDDRVAFFRRRLPRAWPAASPACAGLASSFSRAFSIASAALASRSAAALVWDRWLALRASSAGTTLPPGQGCWL